MKPIPPPDQAQRERVRTELDKNMLVEAAAGSGKTTSMVARMVALIERGKCPIDKLAAVTFTRKAAAELRSRFQLALETAALTPGPAQASLQQALNDLDQCFIGTIHSFCARLLRERPIEAGVDIAFEEIEEDADEDFRRQAWNDNLAALHAGEDPLLARCRDLGLEPSHLEGCFLKFATYPDVSDWPTHSYAASPNLVSATERLTMYAEHMKTLVDKLPEDHGRDNLIPKYKAISKRMQWARLDNEPELMEVFEFFGSPDRNIVQKNWPEGKAQALAEQERWREFYQQVAGPLLEQWRVRRYYVILKLFGGAMKMYDTLRRNACALNYQDLLMKSAALLRSGTGGLRAYFRHRFTHLLVDEFQDTDPIQAEVLLLLTATDAAENDWRKCRPEPGSFFSVGDPKQSIYRFRRADIVTYEMVKQIVLSSGGEVIDLSANFRSSPAHVNWVNGVFEKQFPAEATRYSPRNTPMLPGRTEQKPGALSGLALLAVPKGIKSENIPEFEAALIARTIRHALDKKLSVYRKDPSENPEVNPGDFLIVTRNRKNLSVFARELHKLGVSHQVTGGSALSRIVELKLLHTCLSAAIAPEDPVALVAVLRSELFGISDVALYHFKKYGGSFSYQSHVPDVLSPDDKQIFDDAFSRLNRYAVWLGALPPVAAIERIIADLGLMALARSASAGELSAGALVKAVELLRARQSQIWSAAELVALLGKIANDEEKHDSLAIRLSDAPAVRIMNLHKVKGLEAPVVFLADATGDSEHGVEMHVDRSGERVAGHMAVYGFGNSGQKTLLAHPPHWQEYEAEEQKFLDAESERLLYVAATRAGEQLVISQRAANANRNFWRFFEPFLSEAKIIEQPGEPAVAVLTPAPLGEDDVRGAGKKIRERWEHSRKASYSVARIKDVTVQSARTKSPTAGPVSAEQAAGWGSVIHLLLAAARQPKCNLQPLAVSALQQQELDPGLAADALACVSAVMASELWKRSGRSSVRLTEVPIQTFDGSILMRGVIDLAFLEDGGWVVVDYKTGITRKEEIADCVSVYRDQVRLYAQKLSEASKKPVYETGLFMIPLSHYQTIDTRQA